MAKRTSLLLTMVGGFGLACSVTNDKSSIQIHIRSSKWPSKHNACFICTYGDCRGWFGIAN